YSFLLHCYTHSLSSLVFSFSYRYYVLAHGTPKKRTVFAIIGLYYLPSLFQFVTFSFASDSVTDVKIAVAEKFGYDMTDECVSGHLDIIGWKTLFTILNMTITVAPEYTVILLLIRSTLSKLDSVRTMSENSRQLHAQLLKALSYQACLPVFFLFAVITYVIGQLNIYHHPILEYSTFVLTGIVPMLSPLTSFCFIHPYRVWIRSEILRRPPTEAKMSRTNISSLSQTFVSKRARRDLWNSQ
ncbi:unnamed protein product, partial [Heligmosomoides polygyrus]|uniref:G protein-coupled receptor n=1 Tax=Heligmosomoides polygyrus TaxID=6339 RepID=A0A183FFV5_HELPZ